MKASRSFRWLLGLALAAAVLATPAAQAQRLGIGGQLGDPSGLTLKLYNPASYSLDFLAAWDLSDDTFFLNVHGLYERHLSPTTRNAHFFFGPGAFVGFRDRDRGDDDVVVGVSGTFGLNYFFENLELYAQLTPRLALTPDTDGDLGGGIGLRFYF